MTKQDIFNYFIQFPNPDKNGQQKREKNFKKNHPDLYEEFLAFYFNDDLNDKPFIQKLWHFLQDDHGIFGHCEHCGNRTKFISFINGYQRYCDNKCSNNSISTKIKAKITVSKHTDEQKELIKKKQKETCEQKYGGIGFGSKNLKKKYEKTMEQKYGKSHNLLVQDIIEKRKKTWIEKYGADNPMKNKKISKKMSNTVKSFSIEKRNEITKKTKETKYLKYGNQNCTNQYKIEQTFEKKYGNKCAMKSGQCKKKLSDTLFKKKQENYPFIIKRMETDNNILVCKCVNQLCNKCKDKVFQISQKAFHYRINKNIEICTKLNSPYSRNHCSSQEKEIYEYIKTIYDGTILKDIRKLLNGKELDIYLPDLNLAFEVNGDFWHLNPKIYDENYEYKGRTVESEKQRREEKTKLAKSKGIELIHIWQYDWTNNQDSVKNVIKNIIINKLKNL